MTASPAQRTLARLRADGWTAQVVEQWNPHAQIRQDLFGGVDVIAIKLGERPKAIQATTGAHVAARVAKLRQQEACEALCEAFSVEVWGWTKYKVAVRRRHWRPRIVELSGEPSAASKPGGPGGASGRGLARSAERSGKAGGEPGRDLNPTDCWKAGADSTHALTARRADRLAGVGFPPHRARVGSAMVAEGGSI